MQFENSRKRILVIDDDPLMSKALSRALKLAGYQVTVATDGIKAGHMLSEFKPDAITLDLALELGANDMLSKPFQNTLQVEKLKN